MRQRSNGSWELRAFVGRDPLTRQKRYVSRSFTGPRRDAERVLARLVIEAMDGIHATSAGTVGELFEAWFEHYESDWSPTTASGYRSLMDRLLLPAFGGVRLSRLRATDIDRFYLELRRRGGVGGRPLSAASVRCVHTVLHRALNQGVKWGYLTTNPASRASPPTETHRTVRVPTVEDLMRLFEAAADVNPQLPCLLRLAATTGARRGELVALRWRHVDLDGGLLTIERSVVVGRSRELVDKDTKTHQARRIHLDPGTIAEVRALPADRERTAQDILEQFPALEAMVVGPDHHVFSHDHPGECPWRPDYVTLAFGRLRSQLGLDHLRFHDLRHFAATALLTGGLDVRTVSGRLGHANAATTLNVYAHFLSGADRLAAEHMGGLFDAAGSARQEASQASTIEGK